MGYFLKKINSYKIIKKLVFILILFALSLIFMPKVDAYTVTYPDNKVDTVEEGQKYILSMKDHKEPEIVSTVTFKSHQDGVDDYVSHVKKKYFLEKWIIDGVEYEPGSPIEVNSDITVTGSYHEYIEPVTIPSAPLVYEKTFIGWYDQEEGGTRYKTYSGTQDLTLHAQYIAQNRAPFTVDVSSSKWTKFRSTATAFRKATIEEYNAKQAELTSSDNFGNDYYPLYIWLEGTELVYYTEFSSITISYPKDMFYNWSKIEYIDLSGWYIRYLVSANYELKATDLSEMFHNCSSLTYLDISDFDTSKVKNMNYMFSGTKLASLDLSHFNTSEVTQMAGMFSSMGSLEYLNISSFDTSKVTTMQSMFSNSNINYLDLSNFNTSNVEGMASMFSNSKNANYLNISSFDTSKVKYMTSMFSSSSFKHLDLSNLDVSQANSFENMFYNAQSLEYVDLSNWDTRRSTRFNGMFKNCYNLKYLDLSSFKIYKATSLNEMFYNCRNLEELDLSSFDLNNVSYISYMFAGMSKIKTIDISNFSTPNLKNMQCLFCYDTSLETIYANELFNTDQCPTGRTSDGTMVYVFAETNNLVGQAGTRFSEVRGTGKEYAVIDDPDNGKPGYFTYKAYNPKIYYPDMSYEEVEPYYVLTLPESYSKADDNLAKVTLKYEDDKTEDKEVYVKKSYTFNNWLVYDEVAEPGDTFVITFDTYLEADYVETINGVDLPTPKRTNYIFEGWYTDPENGDLVENYNGNEDITLYAHWREAQVANLILGEQFNNKLNKNVTGEFRKATLEEYNLVRDTLTTDNIVSTSESPSVVYLWSTDSDILYYTDAEIVYVNENAYKMFSDLSVTSIDLNGLDTSNTTNMGYFFQRFKGSSLDVSTLDTSKATDMHGIFWYNENLTTIDVSNFNTSNATTVSEMFYDSYNLETIIGLENFDTSNVTNMSSMFDSCRKLKELDLTHFNTSRVTNYNFMFRDCILIEELDLSSFETVNSPGISYMFYGMTGLRNVYVSNKWDHSKISTSSNVFYGNNELIGYYGWTYKGSTNDETYARADTTDPNNRGYFTDISHKGETNTVTYPDGVVEVYPHNYKVYFRHNETIKPGEEVATVTLKYHDGVTEDTTMPVLQRYSPNGYLINNQATSNEHIDEINPYILTYDSVLEYDYLANEISTDPFTRPEREGYSFFGWYTEEDGQGEKYTQYYDSEDIVLHAYWNDPYAEFVPGYEFSSKMNDLIYGPEYDYDHPAKYFRKATLEEYNLAKDMIESDADENGNNKHIISSENTGDLIYAWKSGDDLLYYSKTDNIHLNEYSSSMFSHLPFEEIDLSGINAINTNNLNGFFNGCGNLVSVNFGDKFDTSNVTDMSYMFANSSIKHIDLSALNTSNVTNMSYMFNRAESLETVNFGNIDTSKVTEMTGLFGFCTSLTEIDLSKQDLNNVQYAGYMFQECTSLTSLKLSNKKFSNIKNAETMFSNCSSLEELDLTRFDTSNLEQISYMFGNMTSLKTVYVSDLWDNSNIQEYYDNGTFDSDTQLVGEKGTTYDANYIGREYARVDNAPDSPGYFTYAKLYTVTYPDGSEELYPNNTIINLGHTASKATDQDVVVTFMNHNGTEDILSISDVSYTPNGFDIGGIHYDDESTLLVDSDKVINYSYIINSSFEFPENPEKRGYSFDGWYTEEEGGEKVESLDGITANTTLHAHWIGTATSTLVQGTDFYPFVRDKDFNTFRKATLEEYNNISSTLTDENIISTDDSVVPTYYWNQDGDFVYYSEADIIYLNEICYQMFSGSRFRTIDVSGLDSTKVTDTREMFANNDYLTSINFTNFDTSNVTKATYMFNELSAIRELDLSNFNTSKITTAQGMFSNLDSIEELDLSSFDMSSGTDLLYMFSSMPNLITIYVSDKWDVSHYGETAYNGEMFYYVPNLTGYYGTVYNADHARWDRAHIDGGEENPGYLTHVSHKGETHTVTYPDGTVEIKKHNAIITLGDNNTTSDQVDDLATTITFKLHNGEDDIIKHVQNVYYADGFSVNDISYGNGSNVRINEDKVIEYRYTGYPTSPEFPENITDDRRLFLGWYTEEEDGDKVEYYDGEDDITLHAHWSEELLKLTVDGKTTLVEPGYVYTIPHGIPTKNSDYITIYLEDSYNQDNKEVKISYGNAVNYQIIKGTKYYPGDTYVVNEDTNVTSNKSKDKTAIMDPYVAEPTYHDENGDYVFKGWIMANWDYADPIDVNIDIYSLTPDDVLFDNQTFLADFGQINEEEQVRLTIIDNYKKNNYTYIVPKGLELTVTDIDTDLHNSRRMYIENNINDDSIEYNYEIDALISHYLINDEEVPNEEGVTRTINEDTTIEVIRALTENEYCNDHETCPSIVYTEPYSRVSFDGVDNYIYTGIYVDSDGQGKMLTLSNFKPTGDPNGSLEGTVYMHFIDGTNNIILTVDEDVSIIPKGMGVIPEAKEKEDEVIPITLVYQDNETPNGVANMTYRHTFEGYRKPDYWRVYNPGEEYDSKPHYAQPLAEVYKLDCICIDEE